MNERPPVGTILDLKHYRELREERKKQRAAQTRELLCLAGSQSLDDNTIELAFYDDDELYVTILTRCGPHMWSAATFSFVDYVNYVLEPRGI